jgi:hypothetical protein
VRGRCSGWSWIVCFDGVVVGGLLMVFSVASYASFSIGIAHFQSLLKQRDFTKIKMKRTKRTERETHKEEREGKERRKERKERKEGKKEI